MRRALVFAWIATVVAFAALVTTGPGFVRAQSGVQSIPTLAVQGGAASGSVPVGNPNLIAGYDGSKARSISTDASGRIVIGTQITASDGWSNGAIGALKDQPDVQNLGLLNAPLAFNGSSWDRMGYCPNYVSLTQAASTTAQIIALSGTTKIRVCAFFVNSANSNTVTIESGTGTNCGTAVHNSTGAMNLAANGTIPIPGGGPGAYNLISQSGDELCLVTGAGVGGVTGGLMYGQW